MLHGRGGGGVPLRAGTWSYARGSGVTTASHIQLIRQCRHYVKYLHITISEESRELLSIVYTHRPSTVYMCI